MDSREIITKEECRFLEVCSSNNDFVCLDKKLSSILENIDLSITEKLSLLGQSLDEFTDKLSDIVLSLQMAPDGTFEEKLCLGIIVTLVGAFSAYLFNMFHWRMVHKTQQESLVYTALLELIKEIEEIAVDYWLRSYSKGKKADINGDEVRIKSRLRLMSRYVKEISSMSKSRRLESRREKVSEVAVDIFELITGDDFESASRKASRIKATQISYKCADIKATILSLNCNS